MNAIKNNLCRTVLFFYVCILLNTINPLHGMHKGKVLPADNTTPDTTEKQSPDPETEVQEALKRLRTLEPHRRPSQFSQTGSNRWPSLFSQPDSRWPSHISQNNPVPRSPSTALDHYGSDELLHASSDVEGFSIALPNGVSEDIATQLADMAAQLADIREEQDKNKLDTGAVLGHFYYISMAQLHDTTKRTQRELKETRREIQGLLSCFFCCRSDAVADDDDEILPGMPSGGSMITRRRRSMLLSDRVPTPDGVRDSSNELKKKATEADKNQ